MDYMEYGLEYALHEVTMLLYVLQEYTVVSSGCSQGPVPLIK